MSGLTVDATIERGGFRLELELDAASGETVAVVGPNGSGKSTLVRAIAGLTPIASGSIALAGRPLDDPQRKTFVAPHDRDIGFAFQDALLFPHLDVAQNISFRLGDRRGDDPAVAVWLERVGLAGYASRKIDGLSGGEARRVAMARAFIGDPALVVLDEPFAGVDVAAHGRLRRLLATELADRTGPTVLITHDPLDAQALADRMYVVEDGKVTQHGPPAEVRRRPATRYVADLLGQNLITGEARHGMVVVAGGVALAVADRSISGPVSMTIAPSAIALHREQPTGSARNTWRATVAGLHALGDVVRVEVADPLPLVVDVTPAAVQELSLGAGSAVWIAVKATSLTVIDGNG